MSLCCCRSGEAMCMDCMTGEHKPCERRRIEEFIKDTVRRQQALDRLIDRELREEFRAT